LHWALELVIEERGASRKVSEAEQKNEQIENLLVVRVTLILRNNSQFIYLHHPSLHCLGGLGKKIRIHFSVN